MTPSLSNIHLRRAQLVALSATQRVNVAISLQHLAPPIQVANTILVCLRLLKMYPLVPVAIVAGAVAMMLSRAHARSWSLKRVAFRAFALWRTYRSLGVWAARGRMAWLRIGMAWHARKSHSPHNTLRSKAAHKPLLNKASE